MALLLRDARLPDGSSTNVLLAGGHIAALPHTGTWDGPVVEARGRLLTPGLTDPHLHPDKAFGLETQSTDSEKTTSLAEAIARVRAQKAQQTADQIYQRTMRLMAWCLACGTTRARVHAEVDPLLQLRSVEGVLRAREALHGRMHLQVVAFPQEGIVREPGTLDLLHEAMQLGCDVVGAISYQDPDPRVHLELASDLARTFDTPLDVHCDFGVPLAQSALDLICDVAQAKDLKVLAGHATTLALMDQSQREQTSKRLHQARVTICSLPRTDLFMDHRVAPLEALRAAGVATCIGTNNVLNAFTPVGRPSLPSVASVYALVAGKGQRAELTQLAESLWTSAAHIGFPTPTLSEGAPADLCLWPCAEPWQIVATEALPDLVLVGGEIVHASQQMATTVGVIV